MKSVTILHPFTPQAAGVVERSVPKYHSQPHVKAMQQLVAKESIVGRMEYFTSKLMGYTKGNNSLTWQFYPVKFTLNGDHKKWKKQHSTACLRAYKKQAPEVTIINMSGHSNPFSYQLSKIILAQNKHYIAMLGGQHYSDTPINRAYYKQAHHILVHTHMQKESMQRLELFKGLDIRVFPLGVDCSVFKPASKKQNSNKISLLYVGRIIAWKRVHLAIETLKVLVDAGFKDAVLNIIGPTTSEQYLTELKALAVKYQLETQVCFLGHKEHHELPKYFQEADMFLLPSDKETFGMVMIEAMACGTPVAGMDCPGGPADVITHGVDGVLATPESYAAAVLEVFTTKGVLQNMASNSRLKVELNYSLEATYRVLKTSVNSVIHI
ncbi:glycosyltransferase family 4 protein [Formosa sp. A9]|uniref:glycosyltransferase family 4 protein n=1 Tax=Formosa sp. A9 TaxID=3442641 RepID=UPI003EBA572B